MLRHATIGMIRSPVLGGVILGAFAGRARSEHPLSNLEDMRGQFVFFRGLLDKPVRDSVAKGDIQGDTVHLDPHETMCIRSKGDALRIRSQGRGKIWHVKLESVRAKLASRGNPGWLCRGMKP